MIPNVFICIYQIIFQIYYFHLYFKYYFKSTVVFICISNTISNLLFKYVNSTIAVTVAFYFKSTDQILYELRRNCCLLFQIYCANT